MWILKKINNNCALARDSEGQDLVVFGKGIAFRRPPYELEDLAQIDRTFYGIDRTAVAALKDIPSDILLLASDVIDYASGKLDVDLNQNASVTLADHIHFAIARKEAGQAVETPLAFDIAHLYPRELAIGKRALTLVHTRLGISLPEAEAANIALHLIDAEVERSDMGSTVMALKVVDGVTEIIEQHFGPIDTSSFAYARFATHLRYLVDRIRNGERVEAQLAPMLPVMRREYPDSFACASDIKAFLLTMWGWECDENEMLYLLIHLQRLTMGRRHQAEQLNLPDR